MTVTASETYPITYASNGNIANKYDAGQYIYSASPRPYRLMDVYETDTNYNNGVGGKFEYLDYNYFNKATLIELGGSKYSLYYGVDKQRIKSIDSTSTQKTVRYYFGSYEKEIINDTATHIDYIFAPSGLALIVKTHIATAAVGKGVGGIGDGIATTHPGIPSGYDFYYVSTDNLGSIVMITNPSKTVLSKYYYQPFGGRVLLAGTDITPRGYTFHEHLATFGLINMNGRFYDPVLARFLSPDPYVQMPDFTQNYNRYSYALNNPFKFTDPSGEVLWFVPIIIGAIIGGVSGGMIGHANGATGWNMVGYIAGGALIGGVSGGAAVGVSALGGGAMLAGMAAGAVSGAGFNGLASGGNALAMLKGAGIGALSGLLGGGLGSAIGGGLGAFAGGAIGSATSTLLNSDFKQKGWGWNVLLSAAVGGALAYGTYELTSYISYKQANLEMNGYKVSYGQFKTMQADYQRSRFLHKEYGGILTKNGNVVRVPAQNRHSLQVEYTRGMSNAANSKGGIIASYHTHWARGGINYYVNDMYDIVSYANAMYQTSTPNGPSSTDMMSASYFGGDHFLIDRNHFYIYNTSTYANNNAFILRYLPMYWLWLNK